MKKAVAIIISLTILQSNFLCAQLQKRKTIKTDLQEKVKKLEEQISHTTTNKARLQRERDMLLRQIKEMNQKTPAKK